MGAKTFNSPFIRATDRDFLILRKLWSRQAEFNKIFVNIKKMSQEEKARFTERYIAHMISEVGELFRELNVKMHRKSYKNIKYTSVYEELVDIFKYWLCIVQLWEMTPETFIEEFYKKSFVVEQNYKQEFMLKYHNIAIFDLDGVLADYVDSLLSYINDHTITVSKGLSFKREDIKNHSFFQNLKGLTFEEYEGMKHSYRMDGHNYKMKPMKGASECTRWCQDKEYTVVILTSRPIDKYPEIYIDTLMWLKKNKIRYDALFWDKDKDRKILECLPKENVKFAVEDHTGYASMYAEKLGIKTFLTTAPYNTGFEKDGVVRVKDLNQIKEELK